jgi:hypothetical protein
MFRISAFIAVLALIGTAATGAIAQQPQSKSTQKQCYNSQTCAADCMRYAIGRSCEIICQRKASTLPACK